MWKSNSAPPPLPFQRVGGWKITPGDEPPNHSHRIGAATAEHYIRLYTLWEHAISRISRPGSGTSGGAADFRFDSSALVNLDFCYLHLPIESFFRFRVSRGVIHSPAGQKFRVLCILRAGTTQMHYESVFREDLAPPLGSLTGS